MEIYGKVGGITGDGQNANLFNSASGVFNFDSRTGQYCRGTDGWTGSSGMVSFMASRNWTGETSSDGGSENRPDNFTIRIWKRTA